MTRDPHRSLRVLGSEEDPEFAPGVDEPPTELDRRQLMKLLAATAALAGTGSLAGCMKKPKDRIMPRVEEPPELTPGVPLEYATSMEIDGYATGLVVKTQEARPTKVEGNADHPASLGATTVFHQASVLQLYDPHRATGALEAGAPVGVETLLRVFARRERMPGLWFLMHPQSSPLLAEQIEKVRARHRSARFAFHSPCDRRSAHRGAQLVFGQPFEAQYRFDQADVVVALDADFLCMMPNSVRWSRDFAKRRRIATPTDEPSRVYAAEPRPSPTGTLADHRLAARPSEIGALATALLAAVEQRPSNRALTDRQRQWVEAAARDLRDHRGRALVVVGDRQPPEVHALGHLVNEAIGALGATVVMTKSALLEPLGDGLPDLVAALRARTVQTLVIAAVNPIYTGPGELADLIAAVPEVIYAGFAHDETSRRCRYFLPLAHYMESWGDTRAYDGTLSFVQPLIRPMHAGISLLELVAAFAGEPEPDGHRILLEHYRQGTGDDAVVAWQRDLQRGFLPETSFAAESAKPVAGARDAALAAPAAPMPAVELAFEPSTSVYDGRFGTITWLQELPHPTTKITWGNAALMSPATAKRLGVSKNDIVKVGVRGAAIELPVFVDYGHVDQCITVELGYGRWAGGPVADGVGANGYRIQPAGASWAVADLLGVTGESHELAITQEHTTQDRRRIALDATLEEYRRVPDFTRDRWGDEASMLPPAFPEFPKWGMTIDTTICSGCSSCVIACQAENNVPVVGADQVIRNREMQWLRIDTYREEAGDEVRFIHQPMMCQHCENAPCEYVCPVYATQHSPDGLNEMIYNRCIGTRFCQNNCPYKVRRFNWYNFTNDIPATLRLQFNANVTVRGRGVMEKCTYCVQRIRSAEIAARKDKRDIRPDEVMTACQQACPTGAIQFGLLDHEQTTNARWRREPRHYAVLNELGTRPRTVYLAKIWNPSTERRR